MLGQRSDVFQHAVTPGTFETDRLASELVSLQSIFSTKTFSTLTACMSLLRISSMLALHVSLEVTIPSEADITQVTHIVWIHCAVSQVVVIQVVLIHPEVYTTDCHRQLKALWCCSSIYRVQNVCQTFLALHHFLGELHQPHSIFGSWFMHLRHPTDVFQGWEADICRVSHAPLMTSHLLTWQLPWVSRDLADPAIWSLFEVVTMPSIMSEAPLQEH